MITFQNIIPEQFQKNYGFIYKITFLDDTFYIGQKSFKKGTDWRCYKSSSKIVKERLKTESAQFTVICYCKTLGSLNYEETKNIFLAGGFENDKCLNENICGRYFKKNYKIPKYD